MRFRSTKYLANGLIGITAVIAAAGRFGGGHETAHPVQPQPVPFITAAVTRTTPALAADITEKPAGRAKSALDALASSVTRMSDPRALEAAFNSYFAYREAHPGDVKKPYLYYVDYGLASTEPRGYVFDMEQLKVVDGPFTVAHGRGSSKSRNGIPTRFSNAPGSAATSLGLYLAQETYGFSGKSGGVHYTSIGLRLKGLSGDWNDNARARGVVAHGAPYVTRGGAGRSEGCPAMEQGRARDLLPKLANGGMVFLFAPEQAWIKSDPWVASAELSVADHS